MLSNRHSVNEKTNPDTNPSGADRVNASRQTGFDATSMSDAMSDPEKDAERVLPGQSGVDSQGAGGWSVQVSIVIVTHESSGDIRACLASLDAWPPSCTYEVVVVDNASRDGTADLVTRVRPTTRVVRGTRRRGFAANCNTGARCANGRVLVFLNPDTRVRAAALDALVGFLGDHAKVGIVGARLIYADGSQQASARRFPSPATTVIRRTPLRWVWRRSSREGHHLMVGEDLSVARTVDWVLGAALAISTNLYRELGGMDDRYRLYCEDIDLCWRTWEAGYQVVYVSDALIEHDLSELTRRRFLTRASLWHVRSMAHFVRRHGLRRAPWLLGSISPDQPVESNSR